MSREVLKREQAKLRKSLEKVEKLLAESESRSRVRCSECGRTVVVSSLTYHQTHRYIESFECAGGGRWFQSEGQFHCPKCGHRNQLQDRPDVVALKPYFKKIVGVW